MSAQCLGYLAANLRKRLFLDQDVINGALHGRILPLDYSYNVCYNAFYVFYWVNEEKNNYYAASAQYLPRKEWPALLAAVERPRLVHRAWAPAIKFWYSYCPNPFAPVWRCFYARSPWGNEPLQWRKAPTAKAKIRRLGRKALEALHLVEKRKPAGIPYPEEAYASARRALDALREGEPSS